MTPLLPYGGTLHFHRKSIHRAIGTEEAVAQYRSVEELEARHLVYGLLTKRTGLVQQIRL